MAQSVGAADIAAFARGGMLPPPGLAAPMHMRPGAGPLPTQPPPAKPARESWLASAKVVAGWVRAEGMPAVMRDLGALAERLDRLAAPPPSEPLESFYELPAAALDMPKPPRDPLVDRMLIAMEGRRVLASGASANVASILQYRSELKPFSARFESPWVGQGSLRARVDYLAPFGVTRGTPNGYRVTLSDGFERLLPSRSPIPSNLMKDVPLYFAGDEVDIETTLENAGSETLTGLRLVAVQEDHDALGRAAAPLAAPTMLDIPDLAPGQRRILRWRVRLSSTGANVVNFEQTHLKVLGKDPAGGEKVLLDEAQAGVVDPPAL